MKSAGVVPIGTSEGPPSDGSGNHRIPGGGDEVVELTDDLTSITPVFGSRFTALRKDLLTPYDAAVATSSSYVLVMTNASYAFYNRSSPNSQVVQFDFGQWGHQAANSVLFDPRCIYDDIRQRWVMIWLETNDTHTSYSYVHVLASRTAAPISQSQTND
jgi:hypothetical protein